MNEQITFWSMILANVLFISGFLFQTYRTMKLESQIRGKNVLMYIAIIVCSVFFNLVLIDKIRADKAELLMASIVGFVFGAFSNIFTEDKRKPE